MTSIIALEAGARDVAGPSHGDHAPASGFSPIVLPLADLNRDAEGMRFITGKPSSTDETAVELEVALGTRWLAFAREDGGILGWVGAIDAHRTE